jgi:hypothetical protein
MCVLSWKYRFDGAEKLMALGRYPEISLADARERRDAARKLLARTFCFRKAGRREAALMDCYWAFGYSRAVFLATTFQRQTDHQAGHTVAIRRAGLV